LRRATEKASRKRASFCLGARIGQLRHAVVVFERPGLIAMGLALDAVLRFVFGSGFVLCLVRSAACQQQCHQYQHGTVHVLPQFQPERILLFVGSSYKRIQRIPLAAPLLSGDFKPWIFFLYFKFTKPVSNLYGNLL
jgi:hypothetical protein